jgi:hypothetical protein
MPNFFLILTAYSTILPSCLDVFLILETHSVAKQTSLSHISLFSYACTSLIYGLFVPDPPVFFYRNMFALTVSLINCFVRTSFSNRQELKREIYLDTFIFWLMSGVLLYAFSGIESTEEVTGKLSILVGAANNFNVYSSIFPLVIYRVEIFPKKTRNRFTFVEMFPLLVNSANSTMSVLYSMAVVDGVNFYSNMIACTMCMMTYILFFNDKQIYIPYFVLGPDVVRTKSKAIHI